MKMHRPSAHLVCLGVAALVIVAYGAAGAAAPDTFTQRSIAEATTAQLGRDTVLEAPQYLAVRKSPTQNLHTLVLVWQWVDPTGRGMRLSSVREAKAEFTTDLARTAAQTRGEAQQGQTPHFGNGGGAA